MEKFIGDQYLSQNDDFTRGWTSDTISWGVLSERPQKGGGGLYDARACF